MGKPYQGFQTPAMAKAGQTSGFKGPSVKKNANIIKTSTDTLPQCWGIIEVGCVYIKYQMGNCFSTPVIMASWRSAHNF